MVQAVDLNLYFFLSLFCSSWSGSFYVSACLQILGTKQYLFYLRLPSLFTDCSVPLPCSHHAMYVLFFYSTALNLTCHFHLLTRFPITSNGVLWKTHILPPFTVIPPPNCSYQIQHSCWLLICLFTLLLNFLLTNQSTSICRTKVRVCTDGWEWDSSAFNRCGYASPTCCQQPF